MSFKNFDNAKSLTKLKVLFADQNSVTYYSDLSADKRSKEDGINKLVTRCLNKFRGKIACATIYDNNSGEELRKYNSNLMQVEIIKKPINND